MSDERRGSGHNPRREPWRDRFDDLKEAYALGALTEDERREFEGYLASHPELQSEVDDLGSIANLLALAPQEYEPSPELRRNLLSRIEGATGPPLAEHPHAARGFRASSARAGSPRRPLSWASSGCWSGTRPCARRTRTYAPTSKPPKRTR